MFDDIIKDKKKEYKKELNERIQDILDSFIFESNNERTRNLLHSTLYDYLEKEKLSKKITSYYIDVTEKNIKVEVNV